MMLSFLLFYCLLHHVTLISSLSSNGLCTVFEPFEVRPEQSRFQIGGSFALHEQDCIFVRDAPVQELVAVQWALTHWNQHPDNAKSKLAMHAGDTCSREAQAESSAVEFLSKTAFYDPIECSGNEEDKEKPSLLGYLLPSSYESTLRVADLFKHRDLPLVAYTTPSLTAMQQSKEIVNLNNLISVTPGVSHYVQTVIGLLRAMDSDVVAVVVTFDQSAASKTIVDQLEAHGITVVKVVDTGDQNWLQLLKESNVKVVLSLLHHYQIVQLFGSEGGEETMAGIGMQVLWVNIPAGDEVMGKVEMQRMIDGSSTSQLVVMQRAATEIKEFRNYFIGVVKNNYPAYSLLATYIQQIHNCTLIATPGFAPCQGLSAKSMASMFNQSANIDAIVMGTYALAALGQRLDHKSLVQCTHPNDGCTRLIMRGIDKFTYQFANFDPAAFEGFTLKFRQDAQFGNWEALGQTVEGYHIAANADGSMESAKIVEFTTGAEQPNVILNRFIGYPKANLKFVSNCRESPELCVKITPEVRSAKLSTAIPSKCESLHVATDRLSLTGAPKPYAAYVIGLFDLSAGADCNLRSKEPDSILPPLAFLYTVWSLQHKYPHLHFVDNENVGAIVMDTCSSSLKTTSVLTKLLNPDTCVTSPFVDRSTSSNVTIPSSSILGVASAVHLPIHQSTIGSLLIDDNTPMVGIIGDGYAMSLIASSDAYAHATAKLLHNYEWRWVTVVVSHNDQRSSQMAMAFELVVKEYNICIADTLSALDITKGTRSPSTQVIVMFTTDEDTALVIELVPVEARKIVVDEYVMKVEGKQSTYTPNTLHLHARYNRSADFDQWLSMLNGASVDEPWYREFFSRHFDCAYESTRVTGGVRSCTTNGLALSREDFKGIGRINEWMHSLESLLFAIDGAHRRLCGSSTSSLCQAFVERGAAMSRQMLQRARRQPVIDVMDGASRTDDGNMELLGSWTPPQGLRFTRPLRHTTRDGRLSATVPTSRCDPPLCRCQLDADWFERPLNDKTLDTRVATEFAFEVEHEDAPEESSRRFSDVTNGGFVGEGVPIVKAHLSPTERLGDFTMFKVDSWTSSTIAYILLAMTTVLLLCALFVLALVSVKIWRRVIKGNQSLGISLLLSVCCVFATAYVYILDASADMCRARHVCLSMSYALCYGSMIAKAMQLRNRETLGSHAPHISYWNYWLLLGFIVAVQMAMSVMWLWHGYDMETYGYSILRTVVLRNSLSYECNWTSNEFLFGQSYVALLLAVTLCLAIMHRNVKRNYKETKWLLSTAAVSVPVWVAFFFAFLFMPAQFRDILTVIKLLCCGSIVLCFMFGPKVFILLRYEPVLVEYPPGHAFRSPISRDGFDFYDKQIVNPGIDDELDHNYELDFDTNCDHDEDMVNSMTIRASSALAPGMVGLHSGNVVEDRPRSPASSIQSTHLSSGSSPRQLRAQCDAPYVEAVVRKKTKSKRVMAGPGSPPPSGYATPDVTRR